MYAQERTSALPRWDAVVVGAGFAGISMLYHLEQQGFAVQVLEAGDGIGGTWYHNRYPGARCDIESLDYSLSLTEELQQEWTWSERYASQGEILRYVDHVVERFGLREHIRLDSRVTTAVFDEDARLWTVSVEGGGEITTRYLILATGSLSDAQKPSFPGLSDFRGDWYHTADWPREGVDFTGRRVGVVGTGSSATQLIPLVAEQAAELTVFQRTANFVMPARNGPLTPKADREWKAHYAERRRTARASFGAHNQLVAQGPGRDRTEQERVAEFEHRYALGGLYMMRAFTDILTDPVVNEHAAEFARDKIRGIVDDPATAELLCPRLAFGTKRLCSGTNYYETFNRDNVRLVDVKADPIEEITPDGLRAGAREYRLDALILAIGFDAMTGSFLRIDVRGTGGRTLREHWEAGPRTYLGVAVSGFPNMFILSGPQSPSVFSNMVTTSEQHTEWVRDCVLHLRDQGTAEIEADTDAEDEWVDHVTSLVFGTLYDKSRDSWFWGANVPGKPRVFMPYLGGVPAYTDRLRKVAANGYEGFVLR